MRPNRPAGSRTRSRSGLWLLLAAASVIAGCSDAGSPTGPAPGVPSVTGTVKSSATGEPVLGAEVSVGAVSYTTGADGRFELSPLPEGNATIHCVVTGFEAFEATIDIPAARVHRDISLTRTELFEFGDFALYVPATVSRTRAILVALGGPDTRGFASDSSFGAPVPETEAAFHALGQDFRRLAEETGLAVLGTSRAALPNAPESDELLLASIARGAELSGRAELEETPLLLYGLSGGAPAASGLAARVPGRVAGLFLKVPEAVEILSEGPALDVPTYLVLAETDAFVDNDALTQAFLSNRAAGAQWALAVEPGVIHFSLTPAQRALTVDWMRTILSRRIVDTSGTPRLVAMSASSGWLGDLVTGYVYAWDSYPWDRAAASWLPTEVSAQKWGAFAKPNPSPPSRIEFAPQTLNMEEGAVSELSVFVWDTHDRPMYNVPVAFSSDNDGVAMVGQLQFDSHCICLYEYVDVRAAGPGTAVITAEVDGITATATVHVLPAPEGVYDLEAIVESWDPTWGYDLSGYRYTSLLRLELDPAQTPRIYGTYSGMLLVAPDGSTDWTGTSDAGTIRSYVSDWDSTFVVELKGESFTMDLFPTNISATVDSLPERIEGRFFTPGQVGGTFSATRRSGE